MNAIESGCTAVPATFDVDRVKLDRFVLFAGLGGGATEFRSSTTSTARDPERGADELLLTR